MTAGQLSAIFLVQVGTANLVISRLTDDTPQGLIGLGLIIFGVARGYRASLDRDDKRSAESDRGGGR